jgi:hypothetical protein
VFRITERPLRKLISGNISVKNSLVIKQVPISDLHLDPDNARKHSDKNLKAIKGSLKKFGQQKPIVIDKNNCVIAGNGTLEAAKSLGWKNIDIVRTELEGMEARAFALADNRSAELAEWDNEVLMTALNALKDIDFDLEAIGFDPPEDPLTEGLTDDDEVPEVEQNIHGVVLGDVWKLGEHRLLCGDSTDVLLVDKLLDGAKADMVFTDPPYGMSYGGGRGKKEFGMILGDDQDPTDFYNVTHYASEVYLWGRVENWQHLSEKPKHTIVWKKNNFGLGRGYRGQYEVCFYYGSFSGSDTDVWEIAKDTDYVHPTQKPVALCERAIKNSAPKNVLDLFLGSGSTLIACEKTNRKCYGMELDPHYCSVIIERWQNFTGKKAERIK